MLVLGTLTRFKLCAVRTRKKKRNHGSIRLKRETEKVPKVRLPFTDRRGYEAAPLIWIGPYTYIP